MVRRLLSGLILLAVVLLWNPNGSTVLAFTLEKAGFHKPASWNYAYSLGSTASYSHNGLRRCLAVLRDADFEEEIIRRYGSDTHALNLAVGLARIDSERIAQAVSLFKSCSIADGCGYCAYGLGLSYCNLEDYDLALLYLGLQPMSPSDLDQRNLEATAYCNVMLGRADDAERNVKRLLALYPHSALGLEYSRILDQDAAQNAADAYQASSVHLSWEGS